MELVIVLGIIVVLALAATGATVVVSRRSQRRLDTAERAAVEKAVTEPRPLSSRGTPPATPQSEPEPADVEIVLPPGDDLLAEPEVEVEALPVRPRLRDRLGKARALLAGYFGDLRSRTTIDDEVWEDIEEALIRADVGVVATERLLEDLRRRMKETPVSTPSELLDLL